jgi:DNA-binding CsgD family transcriptional regulator
MSAASPEYVPRVNTPAAPIATGAQNLGLTEKQALAFPPYVEFLHPLGVRDVCGVLALDPDGQGVGIAAPTPDLRRPSKKEVAAWSRIAAHLTAGARLRRALTELDAKGRDKARSGLDGAEAILSPSGVVQHAEVPAKSAAARDSLRVAAKGIDRARGKARSRESEALDLWQGLVSGRWSLVDQFDSDGKRFVVAHKNDPAVNDPRALSIGERQVLAYTAMGRPLKLIAYALGLSEGTVSLRRSKAMRKLGLRTLADVARLFAGPPPTPTPTGERS